MSGGRWRAWPKAERERAVSLAASGFDAEAIAAMMDKRPQAVRVVLTNAGKRGDAPAARLPPRPCCKCRERFEPETRFIFRCRPCRASTASEGPPEAYSLGRL